MCLMYPVQWISLFGLSRFLTSRELRVDFVFINNGKQEQFKTGHCLHAMIFSLLRAWPMRMRLESFLLSPATASLVAVFCTDCSGTGLLLMCRCQENDRQLRKTAGI